MVEKVSFEFDKKKKIKTLLFKVFKIGLFE